MEWIMKGKRKVQGRKQRGEAVTTKRIPMGALSPGGGAVESWVMVTGEGIGGTSMGMELDGGDCGYIPENDAHIVVQDTNVVDEKPNTEEENDCKCDYQEEKGGKMEKKENNLVSEALSWPLFSSWPVWQRLRRAYKTSCPEGFFAPVVPFGLLLILALYGRPIADGDRQDTAKSHSSSSDSGSVGRWTSSCSSRCSAFLEACG